MAQSVHQAADGAGHTGPEPGGRAAGRRTEGVPVHGEAGQARDDVHQRGQEESQRILRGLSAGQQPDHETGPAAQGGGQRAGGGGQRVGDHQPATRDHMRQAGGEPGQDETVDRRDRERGQVEQPVGGPGDHQGAGAQGEDTAQHVAVEEHLPTAPPVQQNADHRPGEGVRQQEDRHGRRDVRRGGLLFRGEHHVGGQPDLVDAVGELGQQPDGEQPPESPQAEQQRQIGECAPPAAR
jgi:hypothetical protein